jgi:hypothetical protein
MELKAGQEGVCCRCKNYANRQIKLLGMTHHVEDVMSHRIGHELKTLS